MACLRGWRIPGAVLGELSKYALICGQRRVSRCTVLCPFARKVLCDMVFIKAMVLVTNSAVLFSSLDEQVARHVSHGPPGSQGGFFSHFTTRLSFIHGLTERRVRGLVKTCTWISSPTEHNYTSLTFLR